jgi:hypothetical protein
VERDVYINPGEDFLPVPASPKDEIRVPARSSNTL